MNDVKNYEKQFNTVLECLEQTNSLPWVMVIGSWAEFLYYKADMVRGYDPLMKTLDVDFLIPNIREPKESTAFVEVLQEKGFIYNFDYVDNVSHIVGKENFEVEFLSPQNGDGKRDEGKRANIGVIPQQLSHLWMLPKYSTFVEYNNHVIRVPEPEAYLVQKMVINSSRKPGKAYKDQEVIKSMLPHVSAERI